MVNANELSTNSIHLMPESKLVMRIERNRIWVDPEIEVDDAAQKVIKVLEHYITNMVQQAVAAEREVCADVCDHLMDTAVTKEMQIAYGNAADAIRNRE